MREEEPKTMKETESSASSQNEKKTDADRTEENPNSVKASRDSARRNIFHVVCAGYLLYLAVKLGRDFVTNLKTAGWNGDTVICIVGAVVFSAVAVVLLVGFFRRIASHAHEDSQHDSDE